MAEIIMNPGLDWRTDCVIRTTGQSFTWIWMLFLFQWNV